MTTPLVRDGLYRIRNGQFSERVVDLLDGNPHGEIVGNVDSSLDTNKWHIRNVGAGGNQVTIESWATSGTYAYAHQPGGGRIVPSREKTVWSIVKVDSGMFYLQSQDGQRVWELPSDAQFVPILLVPHTGQPNTKWWFQRYNGPTGMMPGQRATPL